MSNISKCQFAVQTMSHSVKRHHSLNVVLRKSRCVTFVHSKAIVHLKWIGTKAKSRAGWACAVCAHSREKADEARELHHTQ